MKNFWNILASYPKTNLSLLEIVLKNCVFSFQGKFYQQHQGTAMGSPVSQPLPTVTWNTLKK